MPQCLLDRDMLTETQIHVGAEIAMAVAAGFLRLIQRDVRMF
jgi:hypothetical protein